MKKWETIYDGLYRVSNLGDVESKHSGKWVILTATRKDNHYMIVSISHTGIKGNQYVHRLVAMAFIDNPKNKPQVNHINGIKHDNNVGNLEWVTAKENAQHAYKLGLLHQLPKMHRRASECNTGSGHGNSSLTEKNVLDIRKRAFTGETHASIGIVFSIHRATVGYIVNRKTWAHI